MKVFLSLFCSGLGFFQCVSPVWSLLYPHSFSHLGERRACVIRLFDSGISSRLAAADAVSDRGTFSFFFSSSSSLAIFFLFSVIHRPLSTYSTAVRLLSHCVCGCERTRLGRHKEVSYWPRCWLHPVSSNAVNYAFTAGRSRAHIVRAFIAFAGHCDAWLFKSRSA